MKKIYRFYKRIYNGIYLRYSHFFTIIRFKMHGIMFRNFTSVGIPMLDIHDNSVFAIGSGFKMINNEKFATLGKSNRCKFSVFKQAELIMGNKVAMSNSTIIASQSIRIGNNVMIGGGVTIVDTDFHSLDSIHWHTDQDVLFMKTAPVTIGDNVFIGMDSIILKGVTIGSNSVIGAGSVVSKNIPPNEIWAGNPAKFIKARS